LRGGRKEEVILTMLEINIGKMSPHKRLTKKREKDGAQLTLVPGVKV
jgi:hypothetical protein